MTTFRPLQLKVCCYAQREAPRVWVALCLDFDLAAQGETFDEARGALDAMIAEYVEDALIGEDRAHADGFLSRRTPLRYWLRFYWFARVQRFQRKTDQGPHRPFNEYLPLALAQ